MTAQDLINQLSHVDPNTKIICKGRGEYYTLQSVQTPNQYDQKEINKIYGQNKYAKILLLNWEY